ncbi:MAG: septal ring lytic transglycosylase RlpA family protein [Pseudomonadota bacterium]
MKTALPLVAIVLSLAVAGCGGSISDITPALTTAAVDKPAKTKATAKGYRKIGKPYKVGGRWYTPREDKDYDKVGVASWYGKQFHGKLTANGEKYNMHAMTAAHKTLPLPSYVRVTEKKSGKSIVVRVNDRGPFVKGRIIDLSKAAATKLGMLNKGHTKVRVEYLGPAPVNGSDRQTQVAAAKFNKAPKRGVVASVRSMLPFGRDDDDDRAPEGSVQVRLAAADPEPRADELTGVAARRAYRPRRTQAQRRRAAAASTRSAYATETPANTGAVDAVIALNAEPVKKKIKPQPLPEGATNVAASRFAGAHDLFAATDGSGVSSPTQE